MALGSPAMAVGSAWSLAGSKPAGTRTPRSAEPSLSESWLVKTVPNTETPKDAPMERKKVVPEVAEPRSS